MTAAAPVRSAPAWDGRVGRVLPGRLLRLELRRNAMLWMVPLVAALFWFDAYRTAMALPALWGLRSSSMQLHALQDFAPFVAGVAAWLGSRDGRRGTTDLVMVTPRPRWVGRLATWAATCSWALAAYVGCVAVLYGITAEQVSWGGPLWWPAVVGAAAVVAFTALGFAAGALIPSRFTAPLAAVVAYFAIGVGVVAANRNNIYGQLSPLSAGSGAVGQDPGLGTFYPYLPDLSIAQVIFLAGLSAAALGVLGLPASSAGRWMRRAAAGLAAAGLVAAGTAVKLVGTARQDPHGMITIPALHDAAADRPVGYTPLCSLAAVPVCLHPAFRAYLADVTAALEPVFSQVAGLPGAPVRADQLAPTYSSQSAPDDGFVVGAAKRLLAGNPPVYRFFITGLPHQGGDLTTRGFIDRLRGQAAVTVVAGVIGGGPGGQGNDAQQAVAAALMKVAGERLVSLAGPRGCEPHIGGGGAAVTCPGDVYAAAERFAALPAAARHAWLTTHLAALRAGHLSLAQLP